MKCVSHRRQVLFRSSYERTATTSAKQLVYALAEIDDEDVEQMGIFCNPSGAAPTERPTALRPRVALHQFPRD